MDHKKEKRKRTLASAFLKHKYGISLDDYDHMFDEQGGVCKLCKRPEIQVDHRTGVVTRLSVDHCHRTGKVRGLLCRLCNTHLGYIENHLSTAAIKEYLEI